jgi:hypothetical protein
MAEKYATADKYTDVLNQPPKPDGMSPEIPILCDITLIPIESKSMFNKGTAEAYESPKYQSRMLGLLVRAKYKIKKAMKHKLMMRKSATFDLAVKLSE